MACYLCKSLLVTVWSTNNALAFLLSILWPLPSMFRSKPSPLPNSLCALFPGDLIYDPSSLTIPLVMTQKYLALAIAPLELLTHLPVLPRPVF